MRANLAGFCLVASTVIAGGTTQAGDYADSLVLGFSPNGDFFAFEEYGIQDGSGFPYSSVYVIDINSDSWVAGTPVRVQSDDEQTPLTEVRNQALSQAYPIVTQLGIGTAGRQVASNPATETSADPHFVSFLPRIIVPSGGTELRLNLQETALPAANCPDMGQPFQGYRLTLTVGNGQPVELHNDQTIPSSRGCPLGYGISEVITYYPAQGDMALIALLNVYQVGFEGPDRRFIAVATRVNQ